jgi:streptogramin lyase
LARIDPATNKVSRVISVGIDPVVTAAGGDTVWVYNRVSGSITQVDAFTNRRVETTPVSRPAHCCGLFTGPMLAADASGAWFVAGESPRTRTRLVHVPAAHLGKHEYPLPTSPTGVAVGGGFVWVVGHGAHGDKVLRIDRSSGRVTKTLPFRSSARVDSIAFGLGAVWIVSSSRATLYKIDPQAARIEGKLPIADSRATRPEIMSDIGQVYVRVTGGGGTTYVIDPSSLSVDHTEADGPPRNFENEGQLRSQWWYDSQAGDVERQDEPYGPITTIRVARSPTLGGGPCLTSITAGAGSLWVTAATSSGAVCTR